MPEEQPGQIPIKAYHSRNEEPYTPPQELLMKILDRTSLPNNIAHMLRGEIWEYTHSDASGNIFGKWKMIGKVWMNAEGIQVAVSVVGNYTSVDKLVTNISEDEARQMTYMLKLDLLRVFSTNWKRYGMAECDRSIIVRMITDTVFVNLTSSRLGTLLNLIKPVYHHEETYEPQKQKGGGFFSWIPVIGPALSGGKE